MEQEALSELPYFRPQRPSYPSKEGLFLIHASLCQALGDRLSHEQTTAFATRDK